MNRDQLLERIREICYNEDDIFTLDEWSSMTVPELRTVVALLDDGGAEVIANASSSPRTRSHRGACFLIDGLMRWIRSNPTNPRTRRPITPRQREIIENAYRRSRRSSRVRTPTNLHIPDAGATATANPPSPPQAPRTQSSTTQYFTSVIGAGSRTSSSTRQRFDGRTVVNVNGQRRTVDGATLTIVSTRENGRDSYTITIQYQ